MRRPPEFIDVTAENLVETQARMAREPFIKNGLIYAADCAHASDGDSVAFPWPDIITELGQLAENAERELEGEPVPAWPITRLRLQKGDILVMRVGMPADHTPTDARRYLTTCRNRMRETLDKAGYGEDVQVLALCDNIEISVIASAEAYERQD